SRLAAIGLAIGLVLALALTGLISKMLFGVRPTDPVTFLIILLLLAAVALLASYIPARVPPRSILWLHCDTSEMNFRLTEILPESLLLIDLLLEVCRGQTASGSPLWNSCLNQSTRIHHYC